MFGYDICFYIIGAFICMMSIVFKCFYPVANENKLICDLLSENPEERIPVPAGRVGSGAAIDAMSDGHRSEKPNDNSFNISPDDKVTYCKLLSNSRFVMAAVVASLCYFMLSLGLSQTEVGYFFMILPFASIPGSFVMLIFPKWLERRAIMIVSLCICSLAFFFCGPS